MRHYTGENMTRDNVLKHWLAGTTCHRSERMSIHWESEDGQWLLMKHHGHSEWCGGWVGNSWCGTHYDLLKVGDPFPDSCVGSAHFRVEGRLTKTHWKEIHRIVEASE